MHLEEVVAEDDLRFARRTVAQSPTRLDVATFRLGPLALGSAGRGPLGLVSGLQRPGVDPTTDECLLILCLGISGCPVDQPQNGLGCPVKWIASFWLGTRLWRELNDGIRYIGYASTHRTAP